MMLGAHVLFAISLLHRSVPWLDSNSQGPLRVERFRRGDTSVVRTIGGSEWQGPMRLIEEQRIGSKEADRPDLFGDIQAIAVFPDGTIAVFDGSVPALRLFGPDGKYLRTLGRAGAGPGEYRNQTLGLAIDRAGVLLMYDPRNARLNRWREDGSELPSYRVPAGLYTASALSTDTAGNTYVKVIANNAGPSGDWPIGLARIDQTGRIVDTILPPPIAGRVPENGTFFDPKRDWLLTRTGDVISGFSGVYAITVRQSTGKILRIERAVARVPLQAAERRNYQEYANSRLVRTTPGTGSRARAIPTIKPFWRAIQSDFDGRIWVSLYAKGEAFEPSPTRPEPGLTPASPIRWRQNSVYDVFRSDGSYLGQLPLPPRTGFRVAMGNHLWAIQLGEDDEQYLIRYRIVPGP